MPKEKLTDRIYAALKEEAKGERSVTMRKALAVAADATNMTKGLCNHWLDVMATLGMIQMNGISVWLTQDYGPRPVEISDEERAIINAQKVPPKAETAFKKKVDELKKGD